MDQRGAYSIIAVNETEAQNMKQAVVNYKTELDGVLAKIVAIQESDYAKGFKGAQVTTIKGYVDRTVEEMQKMSNFILEFETAIDKVIANYTSKSGSIRTSDVSEASVQGEGDLAGVNEFSE